MDADYPQGNEVEAAHAPSCLDIDRLTSICDGALREIPGIRGMAVSLGGRLAFERYFKGCGPGDRVHVSSVAKSVLSALVGIALGEGLIGSLDDRVLDYLNRPEADALAETAGRATLRHLLSMTAPYGFPGWREPFAELCSSADWELYILGLLGKGGDFGKFKYSSMGAHLLSVVLTRAAGMSARDFANRRLYPALDLPPVPDYPMKAFGYEDLFGQGVQGWAADPQGISTGGWGLAMAPREMLRIGELYLGGGRWRGRRVLREDWVRDSLTPRSATEIAGRQVLYGYLWWLGGEGEDGAFMALGDGGSGICCIPRKRAVVAIAAAAGTGTASTDAWSFVKRGILPLMRD